MVGKKLLLATALCTAVVGVNAAEWAKLHFAMNGDNKQILTTFVERTSINCKGDTCRAWVATFFYPSFSEGMNVLRERYEYDCAEWKSRTLAMRTYKDSEFRDGLDIVSKWTYIDPGSLRDKEARYACGKDVEQPLVVTPALDSAYLRLVEHNLRRLYGDPSTW